MGMPVWVTDVSGTLVYLNDLAEKLFDHTRAEWIGRPCFKCIVGRTSDGALCGPRCLMRKRADAGLPIEPTRMRLAAAQESGEVSVVVITSGGAPDYLLIHCVVDDERERRIRRFIDGVLHRSTDIPPEAGHPTAVLTPREREILSMLAADLTLHDIADRLDVSYVTVRNHVAHILARLGVHSILEAVALWVMDTRDD